MDPQRVHAGFEQPFRIGPPGAKHVIGIKQRLIVKENLGVSVETLEHQINVVAGKGLWSEVKGRLVFLVDAANPLQLHFVVTIERIINEFIG